MDEQQIKQLIADAQEPLLRELNELKRTLSEVNLSDRFVVTKHLQFLDARNIKVSGVTGLRIGTSTTGKLSFYGVTPVVQAGAISAPSGGATQDTECRTAVSSILTALRNMGVIAT